MADNNDNDNDNDKDEDGPLRARSDSYRLSLNNKSDIKNVDAAVAAVVAATDIDNVDDGDDDDDAVADGGGGGGRHHNANAAANDDDDDGDDGPLPILGNASDVRAYFARSPPQLEPTVLEEQPMSRSTSGSKLEMKQLQQQQQQQQQQQSQSVSRTTSGSRLPGIASPLHRASSIRQRKKKVGFKFPTNVQTELPRASNLYGPGLANVTADWRRALSNGNPIDMVLVYVLPNEVRIMI